MLDAAEIAGGIVGTSVAALGTATQTNEILQTISLILTILGAIVSLIVIPLINWYRKAKEDKKITKEEIKEAVDIVKDGIEEITEKTKTNKK